jgi:hypothetical protein
VPGSGSLFPYGIAAAANQVYFRGNDGNHGVELWVYSTESNADQDGDGDVDIQDLVLLLSALEPARGIWDTTRPRIWLVTVASARRMSRRCSPSSADRYNPASHDA